MLPMSHFLGRHCDVVLVLLPSSVCYFHRRLGDGERAAFLIGFFFPAAHVTHESRSQQA